MGEGEIVGPHLMYRRKLTALRAPFFNPAYNGIDTDVCLFLLRHADWGCTTEVLAWTRVHDGSLSHNVMHRTGRQFSDWVRYIHEYGDWAMSPEDLAAHKRSFRRYYLRRLARWAFRANGPAMLREHLALAREIDRTPTPLDFADAFADLVLRRLKLRRPAPAGYPLG